MEKLPTLELLIDYLKRLPSVGQKSAERMAYALLSMDEDVLGGFSKVLVEVKKKVHQCPICGLYTEKETCGICADKDRNSDTVIVISYPKDVYSFSALDEFSGRFHVLNGVISATNNITPDQLNIDSLFSRIEKENIKELILATNPTLEGETTALYLAKRLEKYNVKVTRIAYGLPLGAQIDYIDSLTLYKALENRRSIKRED